MNTLRITGIIIIMILSVSLLLSGCGSKSPAATGGSTPVVAPSAPTGITATASGTTQINISWTAVTGATSYNIYRSTVAGVVIGAATKIGSSTVNTYPNASVSAGVVYYYKVTAVNSAGESTGSAEVSAPYTHNRLYAGSGNSVTVVDTLTNTAIATILVGANPYVIAANPQTNRVYTTNIGDNTVSVINTLTNTVVDTVTIGATPYDIAIDPLTNRAYTAPMVPTTLSR